MPDLKKIILFSLLTAIISGCDSDFYLPSPGKSSQPYYRNPNKNISNIGKVAVVELENSSNYPQIASDITLKLFQQLQKRQVFGLSIVRTADPDWKNLQIPLDGPQNLQQYADLRKALNCSAIIFGSVTEYQPYPHLSVGLRLKMIDLTDGRLIWGFEQIWDSSDRKTLDRARRYLNSQKRGDSEKMNRQLISISSIEFLDFVTYEVAQCF
jgi:hypothetical protein